MAKPVISKSVGFVKFFFEFFLPLFFIFFRFLGALPHSLRRVVLLVPLNSTSTTTARS